MNYLVGLSRLVGIIMNAAAVILNFIYRIMLNIFLAFSGHTKASEVTPILRVSYLSKLFLLISLCLMLISMGCLKFLVISLDIFFLMYLLILILFHIFKDPQLN